MLFINKFKELVKISLFLFFLIFVLNKLSLATNTIIHTYLLIFIIIIYILNKLKIYNISKTFKIYKKNFKITFMLCFIIIVFQIFSFYFIYPSLYSNLNFNFSNIFLSIVLLQILNCIVEEIFFRGYVFELLDKKFNFKESIFISSIIFAIYHIIIFDVKYVNELIMTIIFTNSVGLCLGYIYIKTDNLLPCIIIHMIYNISQNIISIEFDTFNNEFANIYIQFIYPTIIFTTVLIIYIVYNKLLIKKVSNF